MKRGILLIVAFMLCLAAKAERVGLVLSGGGARGIAHVGVIKALEDNDIPIDYVTGTSMGAIVGALYSCGQAPEEMLRLFTSPAFLRWSSGQLDRSKIYYIERCDGNPQMFSMNLSRRDSTSSSIFSYIPSHLISPMPMNLQFLRLFGPYSVRSKENFDSLFVPFRCVTSDVYHKHKVVCRDGSLGDAVRQSMSFPLVFKPIERNGILVYDGGIYDNFPVDVMHEEFHPDIIIGSTVSRPDGPPEPGNIYSQLQDMIIQNNDYSLPAELGEKIDVPVSQYAVLDFDKAAEIYEIGYREGLRHVEAIKRRIKARRPAAEVAERRKRFEASVRPLEFDEVRTQGVASAESRYLQYVFNPRQLPQVDMNSVEDSYYRVVSGHDVSDLDPRLLLEDGHEILQLSPTLNDKWNVGMGAWLTTSPNSMLYLRGSYRTLRFNAINASLGVWIGQSYLAAMGDFKVHLRRHDASYLQMQAVMSRQKYYNDQILFFKNDYPTYLTDFENYVRLNYVRALSSKTIMTLSGGYAYVHDDYYSGSVAKDEDLRRDKSQYRVWQLRAQVQSNTLDNEMYPSSGREWSLRASALHEQQRFLEHGEKSGAGAFTTVWKGRLSACWRAYFPMHKKFIIGASTRATVTFGPLRQNYVAELIHSPHFAPTPSMVGYFNAAFRRPSYAAVGVMPIFSPMQRVQARGDFYCYIPLRGLSPDPVTQRGRYDGWFKNPQFFGEVALVYNFPFASLSLYGNYMSSPARNWNVGINFGLLLPAPSFLE